jgi:ribosomal subunit interface protein
MKIPVQISFRNISQSDFIERRICDKIDKLRKYAGKIIFCRVIVEAPHRQRTKGTLYQIHIDISLPGNKIVVARDCHHHSHENVYKAISDAFEAVRRQMEKTSRKKRARCKKTQKSVAIGPILSGI